MNRLDSEIHQKIGAIRARIVALRSSPAPNAPIVSGFPDAGIFLSWEDRLNAISRENLIEVLTVILSEIELPIIDDLDARHDHLVLYQQISQIREMVRGDLSKAISVGYPHALSVIAKTNEIAPDLTDIANALDRIESQIDTIQKQTLANVSDGVAITVGPVSITLGALMKAAGKAKNLIQLDHDVTNVGALIIAISKIADISDEISRQLNKIVRAIPRQVRLALNEVIRSAYGIADKGIELLRSVRAKNRKKTEHSSETSFEQSPTQSRPL